MVRKNLYKILLTFVVLGFTGISAWASDIDSIINDFSVSENTLVSVSVKDAKNGDVLYEKDSKMLLHPASALKLFTSAAVLDYLGADYEFETAIYQKGTDFYIKLSGDPMMDEKTLANLVCILLDH